MIKSEFKGLKGFPYTADFEVQPGTREIRHQLCRWIEAQPWNKEVMGWSYAIGVDEISLSVHTTEAKYLDIFYLRWGENLKKVTQEEIK
jgi:hypothetical protein